MKKIVITQDLGLAPDDIKKLKQFGEVFSYDQLSKSPEEWLERCKGADIICTGKFGLKTNKVYELKDVFFALPFVGIGFLDKKKLKERNITVSYSPGCNKDAVSEWIIGMMINLLRDLPEMIGNTELSPGKIPKRTRGLTGKRVLILGEGNIGLKTGTICEAFDMKVDYFTRDDDLIEKTNQGDVIINTLSFNQSTENLLGEKFFDAFKKGSYFISVTSPKIFNTDILIESLDKGILKGAAIDAGGIQVGDVSDPYYKKLLSNPKILVTPHIAYNTEITDEISNKMIIENIETWIKGEPKNILD